MAKQITLDYYGVEGTGRTVTEAKRDAGERIKRIVRHLSPRIYSWRGYSVVISPNEHGAQYTLIHPDSDGSVHSCSLCADMDDATKSAVKHMLSVARQVGDMTMPEWIDADLAAQLEREWRDNDAFQVAYRYAEAYEESDPHGWACNHRAEFLVA